MINGNIIIAFVFTEYLFFFISLLNKSNLHNVVSKNERIEELRSRRVLSLEEQKEFVMLKYNQDKDVQKQSFMKSIPKLILKIACVVGGLFGLEWLGSNPNIFITILASIIFSMILNKILGKFGLQRQDGIDTIFR